MLFSKLLQASSEGISPGARGTASNNGRVPPLSPQSGAAPNQEWDGQVKETTFIDDSAYTSPPRDSNHLPTNESRRQLTYSFEVDV